MGKKEREGFRGCIIIVEWVDSVGRTWVVRVGLFFSLLLGAFCVRGKGKGGGGGGGGGGRTKMGIRLFSGNYVHTRWWLLEGKKKPPPQKIER